MSKKINRGKDAVGFYQRNAFGFQAVSFALPFARLRLITCLPAFVAMRARNP